MPVTATAPHALSAAAQTALFARQRSGWTGGDATYSAVLPDGRIAWAFGDTFLNGIQKDGSRSLDEKTVVRNSIVSQSGTTLTTHTGSDGREAIDFLLPPSSRINRNGHASDAWYWPGDMITAGNDVILFMNRYVSGKDPAAEWFHRGTDVVRLDAATLKLRSRTPMSAPESGIIWGAALAQSDGYVYIYGSEDRTSEKHLHVARSTLDEIDRKWEYWTGSEWTHDAARSARLGPDVSNQFGVVQATDGWRLLTQQGVGQDIVAYRAPTPYGPFTDPRVVATIPVQPNGRHGYNALPHPELSRDGKLLISYNVGGDDLFTDHRSYRPRFMEIAASAI